MIGFAHAVGRARPYVQVRFGSNPPVRTEELQVRKVTDRCDLEVFKELQV